MRKKYGYRINNKNNNNKNGQYNNKSRQELKLLCKQNGIRANISTDNMILCLTKIKNGQPINNNFKKLSWLQKKYKKILLWGSLPTIIIGFIIYYWLKRH